MMRILQSHPDIDFKGETSFLVPRLWKECFENRFWHNWQRYAGLNPTSAFEHLPPLENGEVRKLEQHVGSAVARFVCELLQVDRGARAWGYKELWNGGRSYDFDWTIYDRVFPKATWIHLIRNPFSFARSTAHWARHPLDVNYLDELLHEWVAIVRRSRERATIGRYFELRYEDLVSKPRQSLAPILNTVGLEWHEACERALGSRTFGSASPTYEVIGAFSPSLEYFSRRVEGLAEVVSSLGYDAVSFELEIRPAQFNTDMTKL